MKKKILLIILIFIILVVYFKNVYDDRLKAESYIEGQFHNHYAILTHIVSDLERYCEYYDSNYSNRDANEDEIHIGLFLETVRNLNESLNYYVNAYRTYKEIHKSQDDYIMEINKFVDYYYNLFVDAVNLVNEIDYKTLNMIKDDFGKWVSWIEENYIYTDENGQINYKMYTFNDMVESGLIEELELIDLSDLERLIPSLKYRK